MMTKSKIPILYSYRRCPYAMRARMALRYSGITVEIREITFKNKPRHMLQISPKGTVPVLLLPSGEVLEESLDIMQWALGQHDPDHWLQGNDVGLIEENDDSFKQASDQYKYSVPGKSAKTHRIKGEVFLAKLENRLKQHLHLCGDKLSLLDIAIFPFIRQFAAVDEAWFEATPYPALREWLKRMVAADLFLSAMEKYATWDEETEESTQGEKILF
jgi:glutathione S-transferase